MLDTLLESLVDSLKLLPFLFITYLFMGLLERATGTKVKEVIQGAGKIGPLWGGILGAFPQCGFSAAASNFYVGRMITIGTLISIYLSTSDEMLPIFISEKVAMATILKIIGTKIVIGMISGFLAELFFGWMERHHRIPKDFEKNLHEPACNCSASVLAEALVHTLKVFFFILIISVFINIIIYLIGQDTLYGFFADIPVIGEFLAALVGLIPNCAASVVITQLYLEGIIGAGAMMSGLLVSAGVGLLVLFEENRNIKENLFILAILYGFGVGWGIVIELLNITF